MGPFGKLTSKLKGQQKEACKNGKHSDAKVVSQKEQDQPQKLQVLAASKVEDDGNTSKRQFPAPKAEEKGEQKSYVLAGEALKQQNLSLPKETSKESDKVGETRLQCDTDCTFRDGKEAPPQKEDRTGAEDAKSKKGWRDGNYNLSVHKTWDFFSSIPSPVRKGESKAEEKGKVKHVAPAESPKTGVIAHESSDLDTSSLTLFSRGLNPIKTRSGPLYKDGSESGGEAGQIESKSMKGDAGRVGVQKVDKLVSQDVDSKERADADKQQSESVSVSLQDGKLSKIQADKGSHDSVMTPQSSQGKNRRKLKADTQRSQRGQIGRRSSDLVVSHAAATGDAMKKNDGFYSTEYFDTPPYKSDRAVEKKDPPSLLSYLDSEFDDSYEVEVASKQLDVIKETESPTFQSVPQVSEVRIFKKWPKDIKSFSHELGPRGGRPYDVSRPHSDNDMEELMAALRARFNTAKEEVDAELNLFAADLVEILDRNADSFPQWKANVEDLLVLARKCTLFSPVDFRRECEKIVRELDERRQELPMGLLKQLHTRMLFILTRCTRLLQFQKESSPEGEGLHKVQQCLKGVPSVERTLTSAGGKRVQAAVTSRKLLPEVLEISARTDLGVPPSKVFKKPRKPRFPLEKVKLRTEQTGSPKLSQADSSGLDLRKLTAALSEGFDVRSDYNLASGQVQDKWDQTEGKVAEVDGQSVSSPSKHGHKAPWCWTDSEREEPESVICRICEEEVPTLRLEPHSLRCTLADYCDVQGLNLDERLRMLADNLEKIAELNTPKSNQTTAEDSPDGMRPFKSSLHDAFDNASPQSNDLQGRVIEGRCDDMCIDSASIEELRGPSLINFKRLLGYKSDQGVASSSAGSGTPRSTLTTPRTSQLDLLCAERNSFAELEDTAQICELSCIARDVANKGLLEEGALEFLASYLEDLHELLARNKIEALTVDTFGRRIEKLVREKIYLISGSSDHRRTDSMSGLFEDDGMSTDDGFQSFKSTPTHSSHNDRISIEDFEILKLISRGAFGRVFLARKRTTGDLFAIKVLRKIDMIRKNAVENILAERDILITVCNPFVVRFFYSFTCRDNLYLVMEYLNGGDLYSLLRHLGCLDEHVARVYIAELVLALEYLHSLGVVHRDLKPDNILIARDGHIKLTDFGLSKVGLIDSTDDLSGPGANGPVPMDETIFKDAGEQAMQRERRKGRSAVGTPDYLAPEILLGTEHGYTADWWSVGVVLYECLTGVPPFNADHPQMIFDNILNRNIVWPHIPEEMSYQAKDLIDKLLTEDPNERLGAKGAAEVKAHPFFKDISWDSLARQKAAFVPSPESVEDTSYFTSRHSEGYSHLSPQFGDSSDCSTSCSSTSSLRAKLNEGDDECGELAEFERSPSVEQTFSNFSFKNLSQLVHMNYDLLSQTGRDSSKGHSRNQSAS